MVEVLSEFYQTNLQESGLQRKPRRTCEENIKIDLKEIGINMRNWIDSTQDRDYW